MGGGRLRSFNSQEKIRDIPPDLKSDFSAINQPFLLPFCGCSYSSSRMYVREFVKNNNHDDNEMEKNQNE